MENSHYYHHMELFNPFLCHSIFNDTHIKTEHYIPDNHSADISPDEAYRQIKSSMEDEREEALNSAEFPESKRGKPQKCKICDKVLSSASSYYVHLKKHSDNKPYQCQVCDAAFCRKPYLEVHMRTHTGEKPFECEVCKKRFTQKSSLNTHKRSHSGLRPYECDICFKKFSVRSYLAAHQWSHVAANGVSCNMCQVTFNSKSQYMLHLKIHDNKKFECEYCPRFFAKESYLIRHKSRIHCKATSPKK